MIVITTPTGDIGYQVLDRILDSGEAVRVIARDPARLPERTRARAEVVPGSAILGTGVAAARSRERAPAGLAVGLAVVVAVTGVIAWSLARRRPVRFDVALIAGLVAVALAPAVASASLAAHGESAFDTPFESARVQEVVALSTGQEAVVAVRATIPEWQVTENGAPYLMAAQSALVPSAVIYDSGLEALPIGGFDGTTPSPTLAQLQADIKQSRFHLVWIEAGSDPRLRWIMTHCTPISARFYDCAPVSIG